MIRGAFRVDQMITYKDIAFKQTKINVIKSHLLLNKTKAVTHGKKYLCTGWVKKVGLSLIITVTTLSTANQLLYFLAHITGVALGGFGI